MITKMNLDAQDCGTFMLIGGGAGSGKTTFLADMLLHEKQFGKVAYIQTPTEGDAEKGGWRSIRGLGLGDDCYVVESFEDMKELEKMFRAEKYRAVGLDTLVGLQKLIRISLLKSDRMPVTNIRENEYGMVINEFQRFVRKFGNSAYHVVCTTPTDFTMYDDQTGKRPDLRQINDAPQFIRPMMDWQRLEYVTVFLFDFCFHIECLGLTEVLERHLITKQGKKYATKQRLPPSQRIEGPLVLKDDLKNWSRLIELINKSKKESKP